MYFCGEMLITTQTVLLSVTVALVVKNLCMPTGSTRNVNDVTVLTNSHIVV